MLAIFMSLLDRTHWKMMMPVFQSDPGSGPGDSVSGSGGVAPIFYGAVADHSSQAIGIVSAGLTAAAIIPLVATLKQSLRPTDGGA